MPLREKQFARPSAPVERWLRRIFIEDWSLKLLALAITVALWFIVSGHEAEVQRDLVVEPRIEGKPAPTYEVKEVIVSPNQVRVQGPASHVNVLQKAPTQMISIEGRREGFDAPHTSVYISDPEVEVLDTVNVHVNIGTIGNSKTKS